MRRMIVPTVAFDVDDAVDVGVPGAGNWVFVVDDGGSDAVFSAEDGLGVLIGRGSPSAADRLVLESGLPSLDDFGILVEAEEIVLTQLADHWHVYANGYHWIACARNTDDVADQGRCVGLIRLRALPGGGLVDEGFLGGERVDLRDDGPLGLRGYTRTRRIGFVPTVRRPPAIPARAPVVPG